MELQERREIMDRVSIYETMTENFTEWMRHPSPKRKKKIPRIYSVVTHKPKEKIKSEGEMKVT